MLFYLKKVKQDGPYQIERWGQMKEYDGRIYCKALSSIAISLALLSIIAANILYVFV